jgi:hypothetical protein
LRTERETKKSVVVHVHKQDDKPKDHREAIVSGSGGKRRDSAGSRVSQGGDKVPDVAQGTGFDAWARKRREALATKREIPPQKPSATHEKEPEQSRRVEECDREKTSKGTSGQSERTEVEGEQVHHTKERVSPVISDPMMPTSRESFDQQALLVHQMELTLPKVRECGVYVFGISVKPGHLPYQVVDAAPMIIPFPDIPEGANLYLNLRSKSGAVIAVEVVPSIRVEDRQNLMIPSHMR